jgi:hypothetical protein
MCCNTSCRPVATLVYVLQRRASCNIGVLQSRICSWICVATGDCNRMGVAV